MANTVDLKSGLLGFSNPNYQLDDAVNCNTADDDGLYDELYEELDSVCNFRHGPPVKNRRGYASLDLTSMGIDLSAGPTTTVAAIPSVGTTLASHSGLPSPGGNRNTSLEREAEENVPDNERLSFPDNQLGDYYRLLEQRNRPDLLLETTGSHNANSDVGGMDINSPDSNDSGIQESTIPHIPGQLTHDLYALPVKRKAVSPSQLPANDIKLSPLGQGKTLPPGWEMHEDNDGPYYWHIKSGTIQRDAPPPPSLDYKEPKGSAANEQEQVVPSSNLSPTEPPTTMFPPEAPTVAPLSSTDTQENNSKKPDNELNHRTSSKTDTEKEKQPIRFAVRSLGWVEIAEEDLTPERSSKAVNKCIVDLSLGRNDILDVVGRWGDGKDLYMDLDDHSLKLVDPENLTVLNTQPIHTIRVWGVGRDNGRDFAYVARDRSSRQHMCHVFRCDTPARTIANTLRDICKKIMLQRSLSQNLAPTGENGNQRNASAGGRGGLARPTNLPTEHRRFHHRMTHTSYSAQSFPTPMEEPKKILKVRYVGVLQVASATGMEVLNQAIDQLGTTNPKDQWQYVHVAVAPSTITISEQGGEGRQIAECRVRFLSFLGIGKNVKHCAFIMHTAQDQFMAHVFYCEPSSGALCKTIEAACKLRYQKCLDAHHQSLDPKSADSQSGRGIGAALKSMLGSLTGRKARSTES